MYIYTKMYDFINEMSYTSFDKDDDILPKDILDRIKLKLGIKRFTRIASGKYGTAFRISNTKVIKITKELKEYEYAKLRVWSIKVGERRPVITHFLCKCTTIF